MESGELRDSDWLPLRDTVPSFAPHWRKFVSEGFYNETIPSSNITELAYFVAREILPHNRDGLVAIGETLETMYTMAAFRDDESLEGLLTIGFLESLIRAADEYEIPLTRIQPLLAGPRTREQWDDAIAYRKPGFQWVDGVGALPLHPLPSRIGMIEVHTAGHHRGAVAAPHHAAVEAGRAVLAEGGAGTGTFATRRRRSRTTSKERVMSAVTSESDLRLTDSGWTASTLVNCARTARRRFLRPKKPE